MHMKFKKYNINYNKLVHKHQEFVFLEFNVLMPLSILKAIFQMDLG